MMKDKPVQVLIKFLLISISFLACGNSNNESLVFAMTFLDYFDKGSYAEAYALFSKDIKYNLDYFHGISMLQTAQMKHGKILKRHLISPLNADYSCNGKGVKIFPLQLIAETEKGKTISEAIEVKCEDGKASIQGFLSVERNIENEYKSKTVILSEFFSQFPIKEMSKKIEARLEAERKYNIIKDESNSMTELQLFILDIKNKKKSQLIRKFMPGELENSWNKISVIDIQCSWKIVYDKENLRQAEICQIRSIYKQKDVPILFVGETAQGKLYRVNHYFFEISDKIKYVY